MSGELPPAVARFIADAEPFQRGAGQAENAANKFGREADKAALSARRMGLAAKEAGEKAAAAQVLAAQAAEKAAKGMLKEAEAAKYAARAVRELERAELVQAAAAIATAEASEKAARAHHKQSEATRALARDANKAGNILTRSLAKGADMAEASLGQLGVTGQMSVAAVAAGLVALPLLGAAVGGAVTVGLGGALIGLGLYASKGSKRVQSELTLLKTEVAAEAKQISKPFEQTWVVIARSGRAAFKDLSPTLRASFAELAPEVSTFASQSAASMNELKPAISGVEHAASALMQDLGPQMPAIMHSLAGGVTAVTSAVEDNPEAITTMVQGLADTIRVGGEVIGVLTRIAAVMQRNKDAVMGFMMVANPFLGGLTQIGKALGGETTPEAAAAGRAVETLRLALQQAGTTAATVPSPTAQVAAAWRVAGNASAAMEERVKSLNDALNAYFNPAMNVLSATNDMKAALAASNKVLKDGKSSALDRSQALEAQLAPMGAYVQGQLALNKVVTLTDKGFRKQFGALVGLAKGSKEGKNALDGLVGSMGGTITRAKGATTIIDRYGNKIKVLPSGKVTFIDAKTAAADAKLKTTKGNLEALKNKQPVVKAKTSQATGALATVQNLLASIQNKTVTVTTKVINPGSGASAREFHGVYRGGLMTPRGVIRRDGGGPVHGPGTETSDSIPALLSNNEYVINAKSTRKHLSLIEAINADRLAEGGMAGVHYRAAGGKVTTVGGVAVSTAQWRNLGLQLGKDFLKAMTGSKSEIASMDRRLEKAIAKLFAGKRTSLDNKLIAYLDRNSSRMEALAVRRDAASKALAAGKQYAGELAGSARSYAGLSGLDGPTSGAQIRQGLQMKLSGIVQFGNVLKALGKRGLSKSLLRQVMDMGPEDGTKYGQMLLSADKGTFKDINAVQAAIDSSSRALGRSGADMLYDAGKMAGKGFLTGLQAQIKGLDKVMDHLALRMSKALKKSLHIKSPSQLPAIRQAGAMTVAGVAAGMTSNMGVIDLAAERMVRRLAQPRIRPVVPVLAPGRRSPSGQPGGGVPRLEVRVYLDGREIRASVQQESLRYNRRNANNGLSLSRGSG